MASKSQEKVTLTAHCLCKANTFTADVPRSQLPLQASVCHCDSCRHVTGGLYFAGLKWPTPRTAMDFSKLKTFSYFPTIDIFFCPTCSTPMFYDKEDKAAFGVLTGVLTNEPVNLVKIARQIYVQDTIDGGASIWLQDKLHGSDTKCYLLDPERNPESVPEKWPPASDLTGYETKKEDAVPMRCKCKGVDLVLHRGDYSNVKDEDLPFNTDPKTHKFIGGFCGCDSCRLQSGIDVFNWTFSEMKNIAFGASDKPFPTSAPELKDLVDVHDPAIGTLTYYASSPGIQRYFCSTCSACIFYASDTRPTVIDVAMGLLEASDGARAEGLLSWPYGKRISFREDGDGGWREKLFDQVEKNAEEYRIARGYPKNSHRIVRDENGGRSPE